MQLTKGAIGNLINRYKAVLKKCHLMNTFGSLAVAGMLIMGGAGVAVAAEDVALENGTSNTEYDTTKGADHLMGGWKVTGAEAAAPGHTGDITLTVNGGTISEIIGGSYAKSLTATEDSKLLTVKHGDITTTISGDKTTSAEFVVGGSKVAGGAGANLETGKTTLTIKNGTFGKSDADNYELVMGGNYAKTAGSNNLTATTKGSSVAIEGGTFHASVVGGSVAHNYSGTGTIKVSDNGNTSVTIAGGTFNPSESNLPDSDGGINLKAAVIGGGLAYGANTSTVLGSDTQDVTSSVSISGDAEVNGKVVAGSVVANGGYAAIVHGDTLLRMSGGTVNDDLVGGGMVQDAVTLPAQTAGAETEEQPDANLIVTGDSSVTVEGGMANGEIIGGNYVRGNGSARVDNSSVTITNGKFSTGTQDKAQNIIGGSKSIAYQGDTATTTVKGNSSVLVNGDVTIVDGAVVGGSLAKANKDGKATATVDGNSSVTVNKGTLAGVIGGGIAETYWSSNGEASSTVTGTSSVTINGGNVTGNSIKTGAVASNTRKLSAAVVGGGLANDKGSTATVGSTSVTIADGTINGKVVAGGAAVNGGSSTVTRDTSLTMTGGKVDGDLIGGGFVDMNNAENNQANVGGSTHITVSGGSLVDAEIIGGGSVRNANGTANVTGDTHVTVTKYANELHDQEWVQYVLGGGKAMTSGTQTATANVTGSTNVTIGEQGAAGKALDIQFGTVAGGGLARAQEGGGSATATVANANVTVHSGILSGVAGGGIAENYGTGSADATVTNANLTINGGTINGVKYQGVDNSAVAVLGGGIAKGTGATANVGTVNTTINGTANTTINGGTIKGDVYAGGLADGTNAKAGVTTANLTIKGGTFIGNIYAGGLSVNGGTATSFGPSTVTFDGYDGFTGIVDGTLSIPNGAGDTPPTSTLVFKNYNSTFNGIAKNFSRLNVADGSTLKLKTLSTGEAGKDDTSGVFNNKALTLASAGNVEADAVNVVVGNGLSVEDGTLTVTKYLKSAEVGDGTNGINVSGNGVLRAADSLLVKKNEESISIAADLHQLYLGQGGTLAVTGLSSISTADMQKYHDALVAANSTGLIKYENADITISDGDQATPGNLKGSVAEQTGALLTGTTVEYDGTGTTPTTTTIKGNYGAETVLISNAANGNHIVNLQGDLTLLGDGKNLITVKGEGTPTLSQVNVSNGKALNLGSAAAPSRGGNLGADVHLENDSSLNAVAGDYTVGDVAGSGKVTANTGANLNAANIQAQAVTADAATIKAAGDVSAGDITLANGGSVTSGKDITVTGSITNADGTLQAGGNITATDGLKQAADGKLTVVAGGTIKAAGITATNVAAKKLTAGAVAVDGGTLDLTGTDTDASTVDSLKLTKAGISVADLTVRNDVIMTNGSAGMIDKLKTNGNFTIGEAGSDGVSLVVKEMTTTAGTGALTFDPDWGYASNNAAIEKLNYTAITDSNAVNNALRVGRNSYVALGTTDKGWLPSVVQGGLREDGVETVLGLAKPLVVQPTGSIELNSDAGYVASSGWASATNTATFGANSLLVVNGAKIYGDKAAISFETTGDLKVDAGAKLLVTDAVAGQDYTIVGNVNDPAAALAGWKNNGMTSTTDMISLGDAKFDGTGKKVTTSAVRNDAHTVFPNLSDGMANAVNDLYTGHAGAAGQPNWDYADVNSADMGVRFLSRATDNRFLGADKNAAAESIESAARIAFAGAAPQMTKMASDAGTNAVVNRLGFADPADGAQAMDAEGQIVDRNTTGFALWIAPLWQSQHGWGMDADSMDYGFNGNLGGVSLGADYTFENAIRAGITFNIGGGYAESSGGDLSSTDNRMNFWGLGAYAGWNYENFGVMADVSYTSTWNDLKQDVDSRMGMGDLEADVQATAISAGLRAEYLLQTSAMDIIPHIGVRYMSLNTWGYDVDTHGGTVLEGDSLHQDIWTFPIGVTFSKDIALDSGWNFKPSLDFSVIPAAGDIKAKHDVHFTGLPGTYEVETQMMDYLTWQGGVGLELANDNMSIGVNYTLQAGQHTTGHGVFGSFRYEF